MKSLFTSKSIMALSLALLTFATAHIAHSAEIAEPSPKEARKEIRVTDADINKVSTYAGENWQVFDRLTTDKTDTEGSFVIVTLKRVEADSKFPLVIFILQDESLRAAALKASDKVVISEAPTPEKAHLRFEREGKVIYTTVVKAFGFTKDQPADEASKPTKTDDSGITNAVSTTNLEGTWSVLESTKDAKNKDGEDVIELYLGKKNEIIGMSLPEPKATAALFKMAGKLKVQMTPDGKKVTMQAVDKAGTVFYQTTIPFAMPKKELQPSGE